MKTAHLGVLAAWMIGIWHPYIVNVSPETAAGIGTIVGIAGAMRIYGPLGE